MFHLSFLYLLPTFFIPALGTPLTPPVLWAQRESSVTITIPFGRERGRVRNEKVPQLSPDGRVRVRFDATAPAGGDTSRPYDLFITLYGQLNVKQSTWDVNANSWMFNLSKAEATLWPRLLRSPVKASYVKVDWSRFDARLHAAMGRKEVQQATEELQQRLKLAQKQNNVQMLASVVRDIDDLAKETEDSTLTQLAKKGKALLKAIAGLASPQAAMGTALSTLQGKKPFDDEDPMADPKGYDPWGYRDEHGRDKHAQNHDQHPITGLPDPYKDLGSVLRLTNFTFKDVVFDQATNVLVQFYDSSLKDCIEFSPVYKRLAQEFHSKYKGYKLAVINMHATFGNYRLAQRLHAHAYAPPIIFFSKKNATQDAHLESYDQELDEQTLKTFLLSEGYGEAAHYPLAHPSMEHDHHHGTFDHDTHESHPDLPHHYDEI